MHKSAKIYIAGHRGLVGSALVRCLESQGYSNLITRTRQDVDLTRQADVEAFFQAAKPDYVFLAAAKVGGIWANNTYPAEFSYSNVCIQTNVVHCAWQNGVTRLLFLGSSCIYPRECPQPMKEEHLLTGTLEPTNEPYALAKIVGYRGEILWDSSKPDGTPRKLLDVSKLTALGWQPQISLEEGIRRTYVEYVGKVNS